MERRKYTRIKITENVLVEADAFKKNAVAYNVSRTGMYFIFLEKFNKDDGCSISIRDFNFSGKIKWAINIDGAEQVYKYGIQFDNELTQEQLLHITQ